MRTEITRDFRFEAAHRLPRLPESHKCFRVHGHSFRVTVRITGPVDPDLGWIVDFAVLDAAFEPIFRALDHRLLNDVDGLENPTSENIAAWIYERLVVSDPARVVSISVHETCAAACTVYADS